MPEPSSNRHISVPLSFRQSYTLPRRIAEAISKTFSTRPPTPKPSRVSNERGLCDEGAGATSDPKSWSGRIPAGHAKRG